MAGEWIGEDGRLHGPFVCECHGIVFEFWYEHPVCRRCKAKSLDPLCESCLEIITKEQAAGVEGK